MLCVLVAERLCTCSDSVTACVLLVQVRIESKLWCWFYNTCTVTRLCVLCDRLLLHARLSCAFQNSVWWYLRCALFVKTLGYGLVMLFAWWLVLPLSESVPNFMVYKWSLITRRRVLVANVNIYFYLLRGYFSLKYSLLSTMSIGKLVLGFLSFFCYK